MPLLTFFLLTFALTWASWLAWAGAATAGHEGWLPVRGAVFLLGVFMPAIVALALTAHRDGRAGVLALVAGIGRWRVGAWWYAFALAYFAIVKLVAALLHRAAAGDWPRFGDTPWPLMLGAILVSTWVQAGEELGWRAFALPRLATSMGLGGASLLLGVIWALWHLPLFLLPGTGITGQPFPLYLLGVMAVSVTMAWLYWKTGGSLLLVMVMHAAVNNTTDIVPGRTAGATNAFGVGGSLVGWLTVGVAWVIAAPLLALMRGARLAPAPGERVGSSTA